MSLADALVQGLLPYLSPYARLQARLVCHHWETAFSEHVASATLPAAFWAQPPEQQQADLRLLAEAFSQLQVLQLLLNWHHAPGYTAPLQRSDVYIQQLSDDESDDPDAKQKQQQEKQQQEKAPKRRRKPTAAAAAAAAAAVAEAGPSDTTEHPAAAAIAAAAASPAGGAASGKPQRKRKGPPSRESQATAVWLPPWREGKRQRRPKGLPGSKPPPPASAAAPAPGARGAAAGRNQPGPQAAAGSSGGAKQPSPQAAAAGTEAPGAPAAAAAAQEEGLVQQQQQQQGNTGQEAAKDVDSQGAPQAPALHTPTDASSGEGMVSQPPSGTSQQQEQQQGPSADRTVAAEAAAAPRGQAPAAAAAAGCLPSQETPGAAAASVGPPGGDSSHTEQQQSQTGSLVAAAGNGATPAAVDAGASGTHAASVSPTAHQEAAPAPAAAGADDSIAPFAELLRLPQLSHLVLKGPLPPVSWPLVLHTLQPASSVVTLHLQQVYLPPPEALQQLLEGWPQLRALHLVVSLRSPRLQAAHIEALSEASQLRELRLQVGFTDGGSGAQLDPLLALTGLTSLRVAFTGIMPDQRLTLRHVSALSALSNLRELSSHGTARALLPQPGMNTCTSLTITGQRQRLAVPAMQLLSGCTQLQRLVLTAKKRLPSVAAVHLPQLAFLTGLTALSFGLTTGTLRAADTGQMLLLLTTMRGLQQLSLAADHRLRLPEQTVAQLAGSWQRLTHLSLVNCDTVDGLACFRGFSFLRVLNLSPGSSQESGGDQLAGLTAALEGLPQLSDLRLNSRSLKLRHVQEVVEACGPLNQLTALSLQLNTNTSVPGTLQALGKLRCLKRLHLHRVWAAFLAKAATQAALAELQQLWQLGLFVDDTTWVSELDALTRQFAFLQQLGGLHQLSLWLGQAFVSRAPREAKVAALLQQLVPLGCRLEWVQEPPDPAVFQA